MSFKVLSRRGGSGTAGRDFLAGRISKAGAWLAALALLAGLAWSVASVRTTGVSAQSSDRPASAPSGDLVWTNRASMPTARWGLGVAGPSNGKLYAVGGARSSVMSTVEEYDPATNAWAGKAGMPTARDYLGVVAASDKVYAIGGYRYDGSPHFLGTTEQYDPATNTWSAKASLSIGRFGLAVALGSNGKVYAVGGMSSNSSYTALLDEYDPATDTWTRKRSMSFARSELGLAATSDGKLYAIGGYNTSSGFVGMVEEYDIQSDSWTRKRDMPTARTGIGVVAAYGKIYAIGGYGAGGYLATVEEYDPQTDTWRTQTSLGTGRWYLGAAVAASGKIYAIGGYQNDYFSPLSAVEEGFLQEPATPTPTLTPTVTSTPTSTATPTVTPTATPTATPTQPIAMYFLPAQVETRVGQVVTAELWVNTGSQAIASIDASLDFESAYLEVVDASGNPASANVFIPGVTLPVVNFNQADNTNGGATFSAGIAMGGSPAGGEFRLAAVRLRARAANATGAAVRYHWTDDPNDPRNTIVADLDGNLLEATFQPLAVRISGANLAGTVQLQGRGSAPSSRWAVPLTVTLSLTGTVSPAYVFTPTADTSGRFTVTGIAPGTYDVRVKKAHTLTNKKAAVGLAAGDTVLSFGTLLEGDANDNGVINSLDYAPLASGYFKNRGDAGYDPRVDFNDDGRINSSDYAPLASNYFRRSDIEG